MAHRGRPRCIDSGCWVPLVSAEIAIDFVLALAHDNPDAGAVALLEDRAARRGLALPVIGLQRDDDDIAHLDRVLIRAAGDVEGARLVLATIRPDPVPVITHADLDVWDRLVANHHGCALELLDWFLVFDGVVLSLGELVGPEPLW